MEYQAFNLENVMSGEIIGKAIAPTAEQFPDMDAAITGDELMPKEFSLEFSEKDYPVVDVLLSHIRVVNRSMPFSLRELAKNGEVKADTMDDYLAHDSIGSTSLKEALKTPLHYFHYRTKTFPPKSKAHFELGTFAHKAFLEPELFDRCIVEPVYSLASFDGVKKGIEFWETLYRKNNSEGDFFPRLFMVSEKYKGKDISKLPILKEYLQDLKSSAPLQAVDEETAIIINVVKGNYYRYADGILPRILRHSLKEVSFYGTDPETGLKTKVRPDGLQLAKNIGVNAVISFKTTKANTVDKFIYDSCQYAYELSEGMYQDVLTNITGKKFNVTIMVMLQTVEPYLPALFWWDAEDLHNGKYKYKHAMSIVKECHEKNIWPGFEAQAESGRRGIINMKQPAWNLKELKPIDVEN